MLDYVACVVMQHHMREQFERAPAAAASGSARRAGARPVAAWQHAVAGLLRRAADRLDAVDQPGYASELQPLAL